MMYVPYVHFGRTLHYLCMLNECKMFAIRYRLEKVLNLHRLELGRVSNLLSNGMDATDGLNPDGRERIDSVVKRWEDFSIEAYPKSHYRFSQDIFITMSIAFQLMCSINTQSVVCH